MIVKDACPEACWQKALSLLARQEYTTHRLKLKLAERFTIEAVKEAVAKAMSYGYIDDMSYATRYIESRKSDKSRQEIKRAMLERGLREHIDLLDEFYPMEDEVSVAASWLKRRYPIIRDEESMDLDSPYNADEEKERYKQSQKLYQALLRRGFSYSSIDEALKLHKCFTH